MVLFLNMYWPKMCSWGIVKSSLEQCPVVKLVTAALCEEPLPISFWQIIGIPCANYVFNLYKQDGSTEPQFQTALFPSGNRSKSLMASVIVISLCFSLLLKVNMSHQILSLVVLWSVPGNSPFPLSLDTKFSNMLLGEAGKQAADSKLPPLPSTLDFSFTSCHPAERRALLLMGKMFKHLKKWKSALHF